MIGAGSWGTALAYVLAKNGHDVCLQTNNKEVYESISKMRRNIRYLKGLYLPENVTCTTSYKEALNESAFVLMVVPSHATREVAREVATYIGEGVPVVHASKGLEQKTFKRISEVIADELPKNKHQIGVLSGPSHAEEVVKKLPTTIVAASNHQELAQITQKLFMNEFFRVYTNDDVIGVELGGSLKNIIALAAGISDGLEYGDNAKAALLTRGLAEIKRLGIELGAKSDTFSGLTGIGDLVVTATSRHSRNWKTGNLLAKGYTLEKALQEIGMVAEGVKATKIAYHYSQKLGIQMPITESLYGILFENKKPSDTIKELMVRKEKPEVEEK